MRNLQALIRAEMDERGLTYRAVAERANQRGYRLSHATVTNYVKGRTRTYTRDSLIAIAAGLGVSAERLLVSAEMPMLGQPFELPSEAALLQPHERDAVRSVVNAFIQNRQRPGQEEDDDEEHEVDRADRRNVEQVEVVELEQRRRRVGHGADVEDVAAFEGDEGISPDEDMPT